MLTILCRRFALHHSKNHSKKHSIQWLLPTIIEAALANHHRRTIDSVALAHSVAVC